MMKKLRVKMMGQWLITMLSTSLSRLKLLQFRVGILNPNQKKKIILMYKKLFKEKFS